MNEEMLDFMCEKVRIAISAGDELDEQMKAHLESCEECRTFLEQSEIMTSELKSLGFDTFTKNGKSVADSVMEEIDRQDLFTHGSPVKSNKGIFRHMGLIAACAVITVMALPFMNKMLGADSDGTEAITENSVTEEYGSPEESYEAENAKDDVILTKSADVYDVEEDIEYSDNEISGNAGGASEKSMMFMSAPKSSSAVTEDTAADVGEVVYEEEQPEADMQTYSTETVPESEMLTNDSMNLCELSGDEAFENVEEAALQGAIDYCGSVTAVNSDSVQFAFTDDGNTAYAVYTLNDGSSITVYLKSVDGLWNVIKVCNGDITE